MAKAVEDRDVVGALLVSSGYSAPSRTTSWAYSAAEGALNGNGGRGRQRDGQAAKNVASTLVTEDTSPIIR